MNIMLANVLERRREIGLLRALGARRRDVVAQFLREASVICISGALLGLLFGTALAYAIAAFAGWQVAWAPVPILLSATFCALVGLAFGVYPARQEARLDPIAALRHEEHSATHAPRRRSVLSSRRISATRRACFGGPESMRGDTEPS